jgi:hypothetical protein
VFEARSIAIEEHLHILSRLSLDSLGFVRWLLIRWRSLRFAESIFGAMVLGLPNGRLRQRLPTARYANDVDDYRANLKIDLVTDSLAFAKRLEEKPLILRIAFVEVARWRSLPIRKS